MYICEFVVLILFFFFQAEDGIRDHCVTGVQTCALPISNCLIAMNNAKEIPRDRWFAMTRLDENRARAQLAHKAAVSIRSVTNMTIWGNHSSTQYPDFYNARIGSRPANEVIGDEKWLKEDFIATVQQRGAAVIKARGLSSAGSAANAIIDTVGFLTNDPQVGDRASVHVG